MCGKKVVANRAIKEDEGSPPHVREEENRNIIAIVAVRITPACAGRSNWG